MPAAYAVSSIQASGKAGFFCLRRSLFAFENGAAAHDEIAFVIAFADESRLFNPGLYATGLHSAQIVDLHVVGIIGSLFRRSQQTAREFVALETIGDAPSFDARPRCAISLRPIAFPLLAPTALAADLVKRKGEPLGKTAAESTLKILMQLFSMPIIGIADITKWTGFTAPGGYKAIDRLVNMDILTPVETGSSSYAKKWVYKDYLDLFTKES